MAMLCRTLVLCEASMLSIDVGSSHFDLPQEQCPRGPTGNRLMGLQTFPSWSRASVRGTGGVAAKYRAEPDLSDRRERTSWRQTFSGGRHTVTCSRGGSSIVDGVGYPDIVDAYGPLEERVIAQT